MKHGLTLSRLIFENLEEVVCAYLSEAHKNARLIFVTKFLRNFLETVFWQNNENERIGVKCQKMQTVLTR